VSLLADARATAAPYALLLKLGAVLALAGVLVGYGYHRGAQRWEGKYAAEVADHKATKDEHARVLGQLAEAARAAADKAKAAARQARQDRAANDKRYEDAQHEAEQARRDLRNALRRGTGPDRLRPEWTCPAAGPAQGGAAGAAGRQDAAADLRAAGAADLVAAGAAADRWITWLQSELISTRTACGAGPP
jgi:hypothetical protein